MGKYDKLEDSGVLSSIIGKSYVDDETDIDKSQQSSIQLEKIKDPVQVVKDALRN